MSEYVNCQHCINKDCERYGGPYGYTFCDRYIADVATRAASQQRRTDMDCKQLLEQIKCFLSSCEKMRYGEYVGAPWPYNHDGPMVYTDPDAVLLDLAATAITELLARAEEAEAENAVLRRMQPAKIDGDTLELATEVLELRQRLEEVKAQRDEAVHDRMMMEQRSGEINARAEKAERERDAAIKELEGVAAAVDELSDLIDEQVHPYTSYDVYLSLRKNADAISMWQYEKEWRGQKEE